jgi:hypothetical protein
VSKSVSCIICIQVIPEEGENNVFFLFIKNKENDPARLFTNRGGALLKELKMKNAVEKGLPKVIIKDLRELR